MSTHYTSYVEMYQGVPFTPSYEHTLYPAPIPTKKGWLSEQYFGYTIDNIMLVKYNTTTGSAKVRLSIDSRRANLYNYMYVSDNRGKEFFAFILGAEYINDGASVGDVKNIVMEYTLQIDVLMTYVWSNNNFAACMLNRHSHGFEFNNDLPEELPFATGNIFEHNIKTSNGQYRDETNAIVGGSLNDVAVLMGWQASTRSSTTGEVEGAIATSMVGKVPNALQFSLLHYDGVVNQWIAHNIGELPDPNQMGGVWIVPSLAYRNVPPGNGYDIMWDSGDSRFAGYELTYDNRRESLFWTAVDYEQSYKIYDYLPRHAKTLMYPYHYARVYDNTGSFVDLQFEKWKEAPGVGVGFLFEIEVPNMPPISIKAGPCYYDNAEKNRCYHKSLAFGDYPTGSWSVDAWYAYYAANKTQIQTKAVKEFITSSAALGAAVFAPNPITIGLAVKEIGGFASDTLDLVTKASDMSRQADIVGGQTFSATTDWIFGNMDLRSCVRSVSEDVAKRIDDYFDRYGYSQGGSIIQPRCLEGRRYTYFSTMADCFSQSVTPTGASTSEQTIINVALNQGVTFWNLSTTSRGNIMTFGDPTV